MNTTVIAELWCRNWTFVGKYQFTNYTKQAPNGQAL